MSLTWSLTFEDRFSHDGAQLCFQGAIYGELQGVAHMVLDTSGLAGKAVEVSLRRIGIGIKLDCWLTLCLYCSFDILLSNGQIRGFIKTR